MSLMLEGMNFIFIITVPLGIGLGYVGHTVATRIRVQGILQLPADFLHPEKVAAGGVQHGPDPVVGNLVISRRTISIWTRLEPVPDLESRSPLWFPLYISSAIPELVSTIFFLLQRLCTPFKWSASG